MAIATLLQLLAVSMLSLAAPHKRSPLEVQLVHVNDTSITAVITNTGRKGYSFLHRNSILDPHPSRKLHVSSHAADHVPFHGMHAHCAGAPSPLDFTAIAAGETLYRDVDVAELYGLDAGVYDIAAQGSLPYAADDSFNLIGGSLSFSSNILELPVTVAEAEELAYSQLAKRTTFQDDCSSEQLASVTAATEECASMASAASDAAANGDATFFEKYFKDSSQTTRDKVVEVFNAVAKECQTTPGGTSTSHCTDTMNHCSGNVLAYTYWQGYGTPSEAEVYYCPSYYTLPQEGSYCHAQTQGGNVLHEMTHAVAGTDDLGYGYDAISALSTEEALANADTYTVFAEDLRTGCNGGSSAGSTGGSGGNGSTGGSESPPATTGGTEQPAPSEAPYPTGSNGTGWPGTSSGDAPSPSSGAPSSDTPSSDTPSTDSPSGSGSGNTWTVSTDGGQTWQEVPAPAQDTSGGSSSQSWNDWWTALMNSYSKSSSGSASASNTEFNAKGAPISRIKGGDREFGDGADHRGHDHTQGSDEHGHWTD